MGCRSSFFSIFYCAVGGLFLGFAMFAAVIYLGAAQDCVVGCPAELLVPRMQCADADTSSNDDKYASRCYVCNPGNTMSWGCPSTLPISSCNSSSSGALLTTQSCAAMRRGLVGDGPRRAIVEGQTVEEFEEANAKALKQLQDLYPGARSSCILYLATDPNADLANPNTAGLSASRIGLTLAEEGMGPGILVISNNPSHNGVGASRSCPKEGVPASDLMAFGPQCFNTPMELSLRSLLQPGLGLFVLSFVFQGIVTMLLGCCTCFFRDLRKTSWVRLPTLMRVCGACVLVIPFLVRFLNVVTTISLLAADAFIYGVSVCKNAPAADGSFKFFAAASFLLLNSNAVFWALCFCGGSLRSSLLPDAGLSRPRTTATTEPIKCTISDCGFIRVCCRTARKLIECLGPA